MAGRKISGPKVSGEVSFAGGGSATGRVSGGGFSTKTKAGAKGSTTTVTGPLGSVSYGFKLRWGGVSFRSSASPKVKRGF